VIFGINKKYDLFVIDHANVDLAVAKIRTNPAKRKWKMKRTIMSQKRKKWQNAPRPWFWWVCHAVPTHHLYKVGIQILCNFFFHRSRMRISPMLFFAIVQKKKMSIVFVLVDTFTWIRVLYFAHSRTWETPMEISCKTVGVCTVIRSRVGRKVADCARW
jgi:hypothetical protein